MGLATWKSFWKEMKGTLASSIKNGRTTNK